MNEQALAVMNQLAEFMAKKGYPQKIHNADGTVDYNKLMEAVKSPEFSKFREANPDFASDAKVNTALDFVGKAVGTGLTVAKIAHGLGQISKAKGIDTKEPAYAKRVGRNRNLQRSLANAARNASQGMSDTERQLLEEGQNRDYLRDRQNINQLSGGQSSTARQNLQSLAARQSRNRLQNAVASQGIRRQNERRYDSLVGREMQEDARMERFGQQRFRDRTMPMYRQRLAAKDRLLNAGLTNAWRGADALYGDVMGLGNMFRNDLPGKVFGNTRYEADDNPLSNVFNNDTNYLQTGQALVGNLNPMLGAAGNMVKGYLNENPGYEDAINQGLGNRLQQGRDLQNQFFNYLNQ